MSVPFKKEDYFSFNRRMDFTKGDISQYLEIVEEGDRLLNEPVSSLLGCKKLVDDFLLQKKALVANTRGLFHRRFRDHKIDISYLTNNTRKVTRVQLESEQEN